MCLYFVVGFVWILEGLFVVVIGLLFDGIIYVLFFNENFSILLWRNLIYFGRVKDFVFLFFWF